VGGLLLIIYPITSFSFSFFFFQIGGVMEMEWRPSINHLPAFFSLSFFWWVFEVGGLYTYIYIIVFQIGKVKEV
jgi:hypothetical protein